MVAPNPHEYKVSAEEIAFYHHNGYLRIPRAKHNWFSNLEELQHWVDEIQEWGFETGKWRHYCEPIDGKPALWGTEKLMEYHPPMRDLIAGQWPLTLLKDLTGNTPVVFKDEIGLKMPGGKGAVPHLDLPAYGKFAPKFVEILIAVDPHTVPNGCLQFVPGSHSNRAPMSADGRIDSKWLEDKQFVPIELDPGDLLIFNESMAHRLDRNETSQRRAAIFGTYHFDLSKPDLREQFYAHRLAHEPPENGTLCPLVAMPVRRSRWRTDVDDSMVRDNGLLVYTTSYRMVKEAPQRLGCFAWS